MERLPRITKDDMLYDKFRYLIAYDKVDNNFSVADYNNPDKKGCYIIDENGISFKETEVQFPKRPDSSRFYSMLKVYTTENYEDVIAHYEKQK